MDLSTLQTILDKDNKRVGRGYGSGKAKTSGRGTKGQKARGRVRPGFEGGQLPLIKRLPFRRGLGNTVRTEKPLVVNAVRLEKIPAGSAVTTDVLKQYGLIPAAWRGRVKVVGLTGKEKLTFDGIELTKSAEQTK